MKAICLHCKEEKVTSWGYCKPCRVAMAQISLEKYRAEKELIAGPECAFLVRAPQGSKTHVLSHYKGHQGLGCLSWKKQLNRVRICSRVFSIEEARRQATCVHCHRS